MTIAATRTALQALAATITAGSVHVQAPVSYPVPRIDPHTLPIALAWPAAGSWRLLDSETRENDRQWEEWFYVAPVSDEDDEADINTLTAVIVDLMQAAAVKLMTGHDLGSSATVYRHIQLEQGPLRDSGLLNDLKYGGLTYRGFKLFVRIVEREAV